MNLKQILADHILWLTDSTKGSRANLRSANLEGADLRDANLRSANLEHANLRSADLVAADLRDANLECANLEHANLRSADLEGANLRDANLRSANLVGANLRGADLIGTNLSGDLLERTGIQVFYTKHHRGFLHENTIKIGCESHSVKFWLNHIKEIGKRHDYSDKEIKQTITLIKCLLKIQKENRSE